MRHTTHHPDVIHEVLVQLHKTLKFGQAVTDEAWNLAYKAVWLREQADSLRWKYDHLTRVPWTRK